MVSAATVMGHLDIGARQARYGSQALAVLLNDAHAGPAAAAELLEGAVDAMQDGRPEAASPALYHLLIAALDLPITCKVSPVLPRWPIKAWRVQCYHGR